MLFHYMMEYHFSEQSFLSLSNTINSESGMGKVMQNAPAKCEGEGGLPVPPYICRYR